MTKIKNVDILHGNLWKAIIMFSFPVMLINLIQNLFSSVDIMVLNAMSNTTSVASVGATTAIISLIINSFFGISSGAKIVLARLVGANEENRVRRTISTALITAVALGVLTAVLGLFFADDFLRMTQCPEECLGGAKIYIQIYAAAAPAIMLYNFGTAILNVSGDTQRPLYYMVISGVSNVALNFVLCLVLPQKVAAVAIATAASQIIGAVLVMRRLLKSDGICRFRLSDICWSRSSFRKILYNGIPVALSHALYPFSNLLIQTQVNALGPAVMAGNSAMTSIEGFAGAISNAPYSSAAGVFVGQSLGAKDNERVKRSILYCGCISVGLGLAVSIASIWVTRPLATLFLGADEAAIAAALVRRKYVIGFYFIGCFNSIMGQVLQNFGYPIFSTVNNVVSVLLFRIFWTGVVYPKHVNFDWLCLCYTVSWSIIMIINILFFTYVYNFKFKKGKIKKF